MYLICRIFCYISDIMYVCVCKSNFKNFTIVALQEVYINRFSTLVLKSI